MTVPQALALYAKACETHTRKDWRLACHALASALKAAGEPVQAAPVVAPSPEPRAKREASLCEFLARSGGIADPGGELSARDAERWHKGRPFMPRLVKPEGMSLEAAADLAFERGYFPGAVIDWASDANLHPVTPAMLLEAIDRELAGRPVYPGGPVEPDLESRFGAFDPETYDGEALQWAAE